MPTLQARHLQLTRLAVEHFRDALYRANQHDAAIMIALAPLFADINDIDDALRVEQQSNDDAAQPSN